MNRSDDERYYENTFKNLSRVYGDCAKGDEPALVVAQANLVAARLNWLAAEANKAAREAAAGQ